MKLHDLRPADGSRQPRTRVGRGIAAGKGKTAGRGTKGQKARAGGSIPPWFEGGQTPIHMRIPKLRGFKNRFKLEYEVVNIGAIGTLAEGGAFDVEASGEKSTKSAPITINQDILRAVGLVRTLNKPLKVLGSGELSVPLFVVADAFTASARSKIEAAGGSVNVLEVPTTPLAALGVTPDADAAEDAPAAKPEKAPPKVPAAKASKTTTPAAAATPAESVEADGVAESKSQAGPKAKASVQPEAESEAPAGHEASAEREASVEAQAQTRETVEPEATSASDVDDEPEAILPDQVEEAAAAAPDTDEPDPTDDADAPSRDDA
jgi:large subunit ribosomal protein L15